jgi:hypothetical protein
VYNLRNSFSNHDCTSQNVLQTSASIPLDKDIAGALLLLLQKLSMDKDIAGVGSLRHGLEALDR